jgi:ureidoglycolate hydrolase
MRTVALAAEPLTADAFAPFGWIPADLDDVRAFVLHPQDCFVLHRGTWHWGPFPLGSEPVRLLNVQGRGYIDDNASVVLPDAIGAVISVVVP